MADSTAISLVHLPEDSLGSKPCDLEFDAGASDSVGTSGDKHDSNDKSSMELSTELEGGDDGDDTSDLDEDLDSHSLNELEADEHLLAMIASGQVELEEDDEYEEDDEADEESRTGSSDVDEASTPSGDAIEFAIPEEAMQLASSPKKRLAEDEIPSEHDDHTRKKPKIEETNSSPTLSQLSEGPSPSMAAITTPPSSTTLETATIPVPVSLESPIPPTPPPKSGSTSRASRQPSSTPSSIVTRTRASHANAGGMVPEHSLSVPKYFNRDLVRVIEIPVWKIRETYEVEEDMRTKHQSDTRTSSHHARSVAALAELERRFMAHANPPVELQSTISCTPKAEDSEEEQVGNDKYYANLHYRKEIAERLRWVDVPGADRFKPEDRHMTEEQFHKSTLWPTYLGNSVGRLLPEEKWAQNLPDRHRNRRPAHRSNAANARIKTKTLVKGTSAVIIPKGFVLKIRSANGTSIIGRPSVPPGTSSALAGSLPLGGVLPFVTTSPTPAKRGRKRGRAPKHSNIPPVIPPSPYSVPSYIPASPYIMRPLPPNPTPETQPLPLVTRPPITLRFTPSKPAPPAQAPPPPSTPKVTKFVVKFGARTFSSAPTAPISSAPIAGIAAPTQAQS